MRKMLFVSILIVELRPKHRAPTESSAQRRFINRTQELMWSNVGRDGLDEVDGAEWQVGKMQTLNAGCSLGNGVVKEITIEVQ